MRQRFESFYREFLSLKGEPGTIAMGMAIGVFVGVTPTIPFHTILLLIIAYLSRQNITAAFLGSLIISNPLTIPFFYFSQYTLGRQILGSNPYPFPSAEISLINILVMGWQIAGPLLLGGVIMAFLLAIPAYFITHKAVEYVRKQRERGFGKENP